MDSDTRLPSAGDYSSDMRVSNLKVGGLYMIKEVGVLVHWDNTGGMFSDSHVLTILKSKDYESPKTSKQRPGEALKGKPAIYMGSFRKHSKTASDLDLLPIGGYKCHKFVIGDKEFHIYGEYVRHIIPCDD